MAVAFKSAGAKAETTGTSLAVPIPALATGDYCTMVVATTSATAVVVGNGWAELATVLPSGSFFFHSLWKVATGSASAANETVTVPAGAAIGSSMIFTGGGTSAPQIVDVDTTGTHTFYPTDTLSTAGMWAIFGIIYAARTSSGTFTYTGSLTASADDVRTYATISLANFRWAADTIVVSGGSGVVQANLGGGSATSATVALLIPEPSGGTSTAGEGTVATTGAADTSAGTVPTGSAASTGVAPTSSATGSTGAVTASGSASTTAASTGTGAATLHGAASTGSAITAASSLAASGVGLPRTAGQGVVTASGVAVSRVATVATGMLTAAGNAGVAGLWVTTANGTVASSGTATSSASTSAISGDVASGTAVSIGRTAAAGSLAASGVASTSASMAATGALTVAGFAQVGGTFTTTANGSITMGGTANITTRSNASGGVSTAGHSVSTAVAAALGVIAIGGAASVVSSTIVDAFLILTGEGLIENPARDITVTGALGVRAWGGAIDEQRRFTILVGAIRYAGGIDTNRPEGALSGRRYTATIGES